MAEGSNLAVPWWHGEGRTFWILSFNEGGFYVEGKKESYAWAVELQTVS